MDILLGGNFYESKPEVGIYDASYGSLLQGDGKGNFAVLPSQQSGLNIKGAVRDMLSLQVNHQPVLLVAKNNAPPEIYIESKSTNKKTNTGKSKSIR